MFQSDAYEKKKGQSSSDSKQSEAQQKSTDQLDGDNVDPVYHALMTANRIAQQRKQSTSQLFQPISAFGPCRTVGETTPTNSSSELLTSKDHMMLKKKNSLVSSSTTSSYTTSISANSRGSPANYLPSGIKSTPNLVSQKSIDSENSDYAERPKMSSRRAPKIGAKMKSLSLDCEGAYDKKASLSPVLNKRRLLKVRPLKQDSFDTPDEDEADFAEGLSGGYLVQSANYIRPIACHTVAHEYRAKFPEELDLRIGDRVIVTDKSDPDWWQGYKYNEPIGIFPSTCVARVYSHERVMQVVQNVNLWDGTKSLRLYRDQVVFGQAEEPDGLVPVRTEKDHRIHCPAAYLICLN